MILRDYPHDAKLLKSSRLYRRSRELYLAQKGRFELKELSAARSLSSAALLENRIEYSPLKMSVYHEQNHRVLWHVLPPSPRTRDEARRYLNFAESLVIVSDMALGDELGVGKAAPFFRAGVIYDPGTSVRKSTGDEREYFNYLHACLHATYLHLEGYRPALIERVTSALYAPFLDKRLVSRAIARAANLNRGFIVRTNIAWQARHLNRAIKALSRSKQPGLILADEPLNNVEQYKLAESWFHTLLH